MKETDKERNRRMDAASYLRWIARLPSTCAADASGLEDAATVLELIPHCRDCLDAESDRRASAPRGGE